MKSLQAQQHYLANYQEEIRILEENLPSGHSDFRHHLESVGLFPLLTRPLEIFQMNLGKMCNQVCKHCHVDAGPDRKEIMTKETMLQCMEVLTREKSIHTVDLTGGAPELNPEFRWLVEELRKIRPDLPDFFKENEVEVVSSLPFYTSIKTDAQRGEGVFEKSIEALRMLNSVGYGKEGTGLVLNLVYNPSGAFLPGSQSGLEAEFKKKLWEKFEIRFNSLYTITNLPISRFLEYLIRSGNLESYMDKLISAFNPVAAAGVMCRNTISIGWDGYLYDCDFNQMLDLKVSVNGKEHVSTWDSGSLAERSIVVNNHCFGCTAGSGSSCGGATA